MPVGMWGFVPVGGGGVPAGGLLVLVSYFSYFDFVFFSPTAYVMIL